MHTTLNIASPVAILSIRHSGSTENLTFTDADAFLQTLANVFYTHGLNGVAAANVLDENDLGLRYRVHEILAGECGMFAIPERYWRLCVTKDYDLMHKIERLQAYEEAEKLTCRITQEMPCCERTAVITEPLANRLDDDALLAMVNAFYEAMPASFRGIYETTA